jgi:hypothetical protein
MWYRSQAQFRKAIESTELQDLRIRTDGYFSHNSQLSDLDLFSIPGKLEGNDFVHRREDLSFSTDFDAGGG